MLLTRMILKSIIDFLSRTSNLDIENLFENENNEETVKVLQTVNHSDTIH